VEMIFWNGVLTFAFAMAGFFIKRQADEVDRLQILLNRTREEVAKEYVTKQEVHADINRIMNRLEVLDAKLDRLMEKHN
jgi:archaellum component FlaC